MNDRPMGHTVAMLEGCIEILEDAVKLRDKIDPTHFDRLVKASQRIVALAKEAQGKT